MNERAHQIAAALDALEIIHHQYAAMFTFTIPHTKQMTCEDTLSILKDAWRLFTRSGRSKSNKYHINKDGSRYDYKVPSAPYAKMRVELNSTHNVRVYEVTYGENSWHPHIHALYWFPRENFNKITDYESDLEKYWFKCAKNASVKFFSRKWNDNDKATAFVDSLYGYDGKPNSRGYYGFTISKNRDGTPRKIESSYYVSGWSGDRELTNMRHKKAHDGHYAVFQLLEEAKAAKDWESACKWLGLYTEYALATKGSRRVFFSARSGITQIIKDWREQQKQREIHSKKKDTPRTQTVVFWFTSEEWYILSLFEIVYGVEIKAAILERARLPDATTQIEQLLADHGLNGIKAKPAHENQHIFEVAA